MAKKKSSRKKLSTKSILNKFITNKYSFLFVAIIFLFITLPFTNNTKYSFLPLLFLALTLSVLWALNLKKQVLRICVFLVLAICVFDLLLSEGDYSLEETTSVILTFLKLCTYALFLLIVILILLVKTFTVQKVSWDTIQGGISLYFLIGLFWAFIFQMLTLINPSALSLPITPSTFADLMYFSFTTLTTLGYGDITPVTDFARNMTILESTLGQIFLTVFVARLVGLYLGQSKR